MVKINDLGHVDRIFLSQITGKTRRKDPITESKNLTIISQGGPEKQGVTDGQTHKETFLVIKIKLSYLLR